MKTYAQRVVYFVVLTMWILVPGPANAGKIALSDEDLDGVSARGIEVPINIPTSVSAPTNVVTFIPISTGIVTNVDTIVNTNTALETCVFAACVNSGVSAANNNSIVSQPAIVSPQTNNFLNSLQAPTVSSTSGSGLVWQVPTLQSPSVQNPTIQVPTVQVPTVSVPGVHF